MTISAMGHGLPKWWSDMRLSLSASFLALAVSGLMSAPAGAADEDSLEAIRAELSAVCRHKKPTEGRFKKTRMNVRVPDVTLIDRHGEPVGLRSLLEDHSSVVQFIFTTCTTICPVLTVSVQKVREQLAGMDPDLRFVSISIDPEQDTPRRLRDYAKRFGAAGNWTFLTGDRHDIMHVLKAFGAYYPGNNKMYHKPYTYLKVGKGGHWERVDGLMGSGEFIAEYRRLMQPAVAAAGR